MKVALLTDLKKIEIKDIPVPKVKDGDILLKVISCAVCGSDVRIFETGNNRVKYPAIVGHEIAGEIVEIGKNVKKFKVGDKVAVGADVPCGNCDFCLNGMGNCCDENYAMGYQFNGGFAEYCLLEDMVVNFGPISIVPEGISMEEAALAEPLACCINGFERVLFSAGKTVLVIGAGPIGIMLIQLARIFGSPLIVLAELEKQRLEKAKFSNADYFTDKTGDELVKKIMDITNGKGIDVIFTACPSPDAHELAIKLVAKRGFINFFGGLPNTSRPVSIYSNDIHYKEMYITGSHGSTPRQHSLSLKFIANNRINVKDIITHRFSLNECEKAFQTVKQKDCLKVIINPWK